MKNAKKAHLFPNDLRMCHQFLLKEVLISFTTEFIWLLLLSY